VNGVALPGDGAVSSDSRGRERHEYSSGSFQDATKLCVAFRLKDPPSWYALYFGPTPLALVVRSSEADPYCLSMKKKFEK
jgi:hypothetical protein